MSEPVDSTSGDVPGRHRAGTGRNLANWPAAGASGPAGVGIGAGPEPEPEPPISLKPPNARPTPPPLEVDAVRIVVVGTALWFAGFVVLLPLRGRLAEAGNEVWLWTCLAGGLLGLVGLLLAVRARTAARRRRPPRRSRGNAR